MYFLSKIISVYNKKIYYLKKYFNLNFMKIHYYMKKNIT